MRWLFVGSLVVLCSGCVEDVSGSLEVRSASGETFTFRPSECVDGGEYGYWGVQLRDGARFIDVFERDDVPHALVYSPGQTAFEVALEACEVFEGRLDRKTINGSGKVRGNFALDCSDARGVELVGDVSFRSCGAPPDEDDDDDDFESESY